MPFIVETKLGQQIKLEDTPFAKGGEGEVYKIITPYNLAGHCVKIYYTQYQNGLKESKIDYMVKHKPQTLTDGATFTICWPTDIIYRQNSFIGFVMPLVSSDTILLYELCNIKINQKLDAAWHQKFERTGSNTLMNRLKLCVNIASAIHQIHVTNKYVLVDMKPQNILVAPNGKISIIDLDSIQIAQNINVIHQGHVATAEYTPPEGSQLKPAMDFIPETWDRFSLAVVFYQFLFGLHPFVATSTGQYVNITTLDESIKNGLFVFGSKSQYLQLPVLHSNFNILPQKLKECFINALDKGNSNPNLRPSSEEWGKAIYAELNPVAINKSTNNNQPQVVFMDKIVEKQVEKVVYKDKDNSLLIGFSTIMTVLALIAILNWVNNENHLGSFQQEKTELQNQLNSIKTEKTELQEKLKKIAQGKPFIIESIDFENSGERGDFKNRFNFDKIKYISPRAKIIPLQDLGNIKLFIKYFYPDGSIDRNPDVSPEGYTFDIEQYISSNTKEVSGSGWGSKEGRSFVRGKHKVEIWYDGKMIGSDTFIVTD